MRTRSRQSGYTLIEILVVLAILGILGIAAGAYITMPRQKPAVQNLLSELEGLIAESHKYSASTLGNVQIEGLGSWSGKTLEVNFQTTGTGARVVNSFKSASFGDWSYAGIDDGDGSMVGVAVGTETLESALSSLSLDVQLELSNALKNPLLNGGGQKVQINAFNKQFMVPFCIPVVGLQGGKTFAGAPAGYLIVSGNRIYKFYKSGMGSTHPWRRL
ncbi:MAG TPA: type II secretion system protein [Holophagaceae bacterium]|nr:type II secretion system protein [Holophagaceae bacterium]